MSVHFDLNKGMEHPKTSKIVVTLVVVIVVAILIIFMYLVFNGNHNKIVNSRANAQHG